MCGIAGYFGTQLIDEQRASACLDQMRRRGPDSTGTYRNRTAAGREVLLLHSRLSIIDLDDRANQPLREGTGIIAYNGELYNYVELKDILKKQGEQFATTSDTEVLAKWLKRYGWKGLDDCEGMWGFAYFDESSGSLMLSRDRFGEKPLYVYHDAEGIYFGSEIKFITALLGCRLPINYAHVYRYLVNGYKSLYKNSTGFYRRLEQLPAATVMTINAAGDSQQTKYWQPKFEPDDSLTHKNCVDLVRESLYRSVELRLRADVPLAFCMSGGIDSNALISIAKRVFDYDVEGFTIVNTDERYDEWDIVEASVRELGIRHHAVPVTTSQFIPRLRELICYHDAPVATITYYAQWLLAKAIAEKGYRIYVSGTAADEIFSGYYDHHNAYLYEIRRDSELLATALGNWRKYIKPIVRNPYLQDPRIFLERPSFRDHIFFDEDEFSAYLVHPWREAFAEQTFCEDLLRNRMLNELLHEIVPMILNEDDLNAMYYSIENRSPYLDRELVDVCNRIPTRYLIRDGYAKVLLRDAVRGVAPDIVLDNHQKVGFNAPIFSFLDVTDGDVRAQLLDNSPIYEHVRRDRIEALIQSPNLPNSKSKFLFYFLNAKIFLEELAA